MKLAASSKVGSLVLGVLSLCAVASTSAWALVNPLIEECHVKGGDFEVLNPGETEDLPMCVFGSASIGAIALKSVSSGESAQAVSAFLVSAPVDAAQTCSTYGADEVTGTTSDTGQNYAVCKFSDGSIIDEETLARGANDPANSALKRALR